MADVLPEFESTDVLGTTDTYTGSVGTTAVNVPASAGNHIDELSIRCAVDQITIKRLEFSLDGGTNWFRLRVGEFYTEEPRGSITQIKIRAAGVGVTSVNYEISMNRGQ
jgi:hypothetical protein